jgi:7-cyano-7-deazaguanine synthase
MTNKKALVILSGGQDSSTCLFWAIGRFEKVWAVGFDYGQRHHSELEAAAVISGLAGIFYRIFNIDTLSCVSKNALTNSEVEINSELSSDQPPNTFVEGRNLLFLMYAAVYAKQMEADNLIIGAGQTDYSGYPDCRNSFIRSANITLNLAFNHEFVVHTPLMWKTKAQIWQMAEDLGVFDIIRNKTVTCYNGIVSDGCGKCPSCLLRRKGLEDYLTSKTVIL